MSSDPGSSTSAESLNEEDALKDALFEHISTTESAGTFAAFGEITNFILPGISIEPIGPIRLPLSQEDAKALIQISRLAPFGNGTETVVDASVRQTWEVDGTSVSFLNPKWQICLNQIVENVAHELGIAGGSSSVRAELYKMLLYEKGAMFKAHKDTEKVEGMVGTLVICLPSGHQGGAVCLEHGKERKRLDTSKSSAFGATYLAWYADVFHEIEPVQSGYRWVVTYNLIKTSCDRDYSASELDSRVHGLTRLLTQWDDLDHDVPFVAWALEHKYTNKGLKLVLLKGKDSCRVRHVVQSCTEHGKFFCFLANMERCVKDFQSEEEYTESELYLTHVVDTDGFDLMVHKGLHISESGVLQHVHDEYRAPDAQRGGGYMGNQHAEIDQLYQDSVMILIPERYVLGFLVTRDGPTSALGNFIKKLERRVELKRHDQASKEFLVQICQTALSIRWGNSVHQDSVSGYVAVAAAFLRETPLFKMAVDKASDVFALDSYAEMGKLICFPQRLASEREIVGGDIPEDEFIRALKRSKNLHRTYSAIKSFESGFLLGNPGREQMVPRDYVKRWLDSIVVEYFHELQRVCEQDASTLVIAILDCRENDFRQNVIYQNVRILVNRFCHEQKFIIALMVETLIHLPGSGSSAKYLQSLVRQILDLVVSTFDLEFYAHYVKALPARGPASKHDAGPIRAFYKSACELQRTTLLDKFQEQSAGLTKAQWGDFFPAFLGELIDVADTSSSTVQGCVKSLIDTYIMQTVGKEPEKPLDWLRSEEVVSDSGRTCSCVRQLNDFLLDPNAPTCEPICEKTDKDCYASYDFHYLDKKRAGDTVICSKTLGRWERAHKEWERNANDAIRVLRQIPRETLKQCLAHHYDETMDLRRMKAVNSSARLEGAVIPSKRIWVDE